MLWTSAKILFRNYVVWKEKKNRFMFSRHHQNAGTRHHDVRWTLRWICKLCSEGLSWLLLDVFLVAVQVCLRSLLSTFGRNQVFWPIPSPIPPLVTRTRLHHNNIKRDSGIEIPEARVAIRSDNTAVDRYFSGPLRQHFPPLIMPTIIWIKTR